MPKFNQSTGRAAGTNRRSPPMSDPVIDWVGLPPELLRAVATRLPTLADYVRFRAVCRSWRAAALVAQRHLPREFPWLMVPLGRSSNRRRFFNPLTKDRHHLTLPEASHGRRCAGSCHGWLVVVNESPAFFLINPLTRARIALPPLSAFPNVVNFDFYSIGREYTLRSPDDELYFHSLKQMRDLFLKKVILSHSPCQESKFFALAVLNQYENLAYCKSGDGSWKIIDGVRSYVEDLIYYRGAFYAVNIFGSMAICDVNVGDLPKVSFIDVGQQIDGDMQYLVDAMGDILLVSRYLDFEIGIEHYVEVCKTVMFRVFRFDWNEKRWENMGSLGDKLLFLGENSSFAVVASDYPECQGNRIYFTNDYSGTNYKTIAGDHDVGFFNLEDGSIGTIPCYYPGNSQWPIWITPCLC